MTFERDFSSFELLRHAAPRMLMSLVVMSYLVVDGLLVSRYLGTTALASISLSYPIVSFLMAFGVMTASGCGTCAARSLGSGKPNEARTYLATALCTNGSFGLLLGGISFAFLPVIFERIGMPAEARDLAATYMRILLAAAPLFLLSFVVQTFLTVCARPKDALLVAVVSGVVNAAADWFALSILGTGIEGAACATVLSWLTAVLFGLVLLARPQCAASLRFVRPSLGKLPAIFRTGGFEFTSNLCGVFTLWFFNRAFLAELGVDGVAALSVATFTVFVFNAAYHGYCEAVAPIVAYKSGANDRRGVLQTLRRALFAALCLSLSAYMCSSIAGSAVFGYFAAENTTVIALLKIAYPIQALSLLFLGLNLFLTYALAALAFGGCASAVSLLRTFILPCAAIAVLPAAAEAIESSGLAQLVELSASPLWFAVPFAELVTLFAAGTLLFAKAKLSQPTGCGA